MSTFTFNPVKATPTVDWNTPSDWLPTSVPDSSDADVIILVITPPSPLLTIENTESYIVNSVTVDTALAIDGTLSIVSDLTLDDGSRLELAGSLALGSLPNAGPTVSEIYGWGQISSPGTIDNQGVIFADNASPLNLDFAGLQNAGLIESIQTRYQPPITVNIDIGTAAGAFTNLSSGTLLANGGTIEINAGSGSGFDNPSAGTLTLGTYEVASGGEINFNIGSDITDDAATIILSPGTGPTALEAEVNGTEYGLGQTLQTIAPTGVLLLNDTTFTNANPLTVDGLVLLQPGPLALEESMATATLSAPGITIQSGGTVIGGGYIDGPITNNGMLIASYPALDIQYQQGDQFGVDLVLNSSVTGTGTMAILSGNFYRYGFGRNPTELEIVGAVTNAVAFGNGPNGILVLDDPTQFVGPISGFTNGVDVVQYGFQGFYTSFPSSDRIILYGFSASAITNLDYNGTSAAGTLSFDDDGKSMALNFVGDYSLDDFAVSAGPQAISTSPPSVEISLDTPVLCFVTGTMIATQAGETPVEQLMVGDMVRTASGGIRPITWIGEGRVLATRGRRSAATPVIVRKGALADNVPHRDLKVTKGHAFYLHDVLIPVEFLVNHRSIYWDDRAQEVSLYHIELDTHDVLLANGAPAESYRDDGNRWLFQNANSGWDLQPKPPCAPVLTGGPIVDTIWWQILARSGPRPQLPLTQDPDLHLLVNGQRIDAVTRTNNVCVFRLPSAFHAQHPPAVRIISHAAAPQELGLARDPRSLGIALRRIAIRQGTRFQVIEADDPRLSDGLHAFEIDNAFRWTNGDTRLPDTLFAGFTGPVEIAIHYAATAHYIDDGASRQTA